MGSMDLCLHEYFDAVHIPVEMGVSKVEVPSMAPGLPTNLHLLSTLTQLKFTYHALVSLPPRPPLFMNSKMDVLDYPRKFTFVTLQTTKRLSRHLLSTLSLSLSVALTIVTMLQA